jgi:hypothetical protein
MPNAQALLQKSRRELFQSLITIVFGLATDGIHVFAQRSIAPIKTGRLFGVAGHAFARRLEKGFRGSGLETGVVTSGKPEVTAGFAGVVSIVVDKCS